MKNARNLLPAAAGLSFLAACAPLALAQQASVSISIKDHRFEPAEVHVPANSPVTLVVKNLDPTPEEFESKTLRVEKLVAGNATITVQIRPLSAGRYRFFGDYHESTAEGYLVVE